MKKSILISLFPQKNTESFCEIPKFKQGKIYVDLPHGYFNSLDELKVYIESLKDLGVNVILLLPHFLPSSSPYVVKDYESVTSLFKDWDTFSNFMKFISDLGMDRMIDIPINHADKQVLNLSEKFFLEYETGGVEAGTFDVDADDNIIEIKWGAYILDNSNLDLIDYWIKKVLFPHVSERNVNAVRIDAAWGLDSEGLKKLVRETKEKYPNTWFLAENLGMNQLIKLARSGIEAGADRFFNNFYWYSGGRSIPSDIYRFYTKSMGKPTCNIWSSHDVLMPAMKALGTLRGKDFKGKNDKYIHREIVDKEGTDSLLKLDSDLVDSVLTIMKQDYLLAALFSTDIMFLAGSEKCLLKRYSVIESTPEDFKLGIESDVPEFIKRVNKIKFSFEIFNTEGVVIPFGDWERGKLGVKGYVKQTNEELLVIMVNNDLLEKNKLTQKLPQKLQKYNEFYEITFEGIKNCPEIKDIKEVTLEPGDGYIIFARK